MPLHTTFQTELLEAGCDEAGRGALAGPVFAAAVILPPDFSDEKLNDSKLLSEAERERMRAIIEEQALAFAVAHVSETEIDHINILNASILAMHKALAKLKVVPQLIVVDGNRFKPFNNIPHQLVVKGDATYQHIAAASILAKTYRDAWMEKLHRKFPQYGWAQNKGYGTAEHRAAILKLGRCKHHRHSFVLKESQQELFG